MVTVGNTFQIFWRQWASTRQALVRKAGFDPRRLGALLASIPYTKLRHLVNVPLNILLRKRENPGLQKNREHRRPRSWASEYQQFRPQQLLSFDACVRWAMRGSLSGRQSGANSPQAAHPGLRELCRIRSFI
jgi:hypothetical protein